MWGGQGARNLGGGGPARNPSTTIPQAAQQDDIFSPVSRLSSQNSFRFGSQASISQTQPPQAQPQPGGDEFPPLNRNGNGEIGQERTNVLTGLNFPPQGSVPSSSAQASRSGNGLLNAVTASARTVEVRSPVGKLFCVSFLTCCSMTHCRSGTRPADSTPPTADDEARRKSSSVQAPVQDPAGLPTELRNPLGAIGNEGQVSKANDVPVEIPSAAVQDPLAGMSEADKWGIKGLLALMAKFPAYSALVHGMNPAELGLDLNSEACVLPFPQV